MSLSLLIGQSSIPLALIVGAAGAFIGYRLGCHQSSSTFSSDSSIIGNNDEGGEYKMVILVRSDLNMVLREK